MNKNKEKQESCKGAKNKGKSIDSDFWEAFLQERDFLINNLKSKNSVLSFEDCEDICSNFVLFYAEQASNEEKPGKRFEDLNRVNFVSRVEWKMLDFIARRNAIRRGRDVFHSSIDDEEFTGWDSVLSVEPEEIESSEVVFFLLSALDEAFQLCDGKNLFVVRALRRWLEAGCPSESWTDFLLPEEVEEFMKLKKGVSLAGKASPAFCAVKQILREILEKKGMSEGLAA